FAPSPIESPRSETARLPSTRRSPAPWVAGLVAVLASSVPLCAAEEGNAATPSGPPSRVDADLRSASVEAIAAAIRETYIFADKAEAMAQRIESRLEAGAYDDASKLLTFAGLLTQDLRSESHDLHLNVSPMPASEYGSSGGELDQDELRRQYVEALKRDNYGFRRVERLPGNIGYLDLRSFAPAEEGGETAVAAMGFLAGSDALIFDVRNNGGGAPSMIQLITSYLLPEPTHLNSFYVRETDETQQFWTQAHVRGERMTEVPVYVLTSQRTFSAAEEFSYNLRHLERATLVGETTGGGAHPVVSRRWPELGLRMFLPYGRAVNPISGTNWEGTGVEPHVDVPAAHAFDMAYRKALDDLLAATEDPTRRAGLEWALDGIVDGSELPVLDAAALEAYVGTYGPRVIELRDGGLHYQRSGGPSRRLAPLAEDVFALEGVDYFRIRFERDADGRVQTLVGLYQDGREESSPRS
ncbi:MAG: S41 family peptidase, partial [Holophagales bacterium]|nr:S41 family peptidase [Holophagales bacterium]